MIPEILGRIPILVALDALTEEDLFRVLTEPQNALLKQYENIFKLSGVDLHITVPALHEIAKKAFDKGTGARGLRRIMEDLLTDAMYEVPGSGVRYCLVTLEVVKGNSEAIYLSRGQQSLFHAQIEAEEEEWKEKHNNNETMVDDKENFNPIENATPAKREAYGGIP